MNSLEESFNQSALSRLLNTPAGRVFRVVAGIAFLAVGYAYRTVTPGILSMAWGVFPLTAGSFDVCYISAALGGPISGKKIRQRQQSS